MKGAKSVTAPVCPGTPDIPSIMMSSPPQNQASESSVVRDVGSQERPIVEVVGLSETTFNGCAKERNEGMFHDMRPKAYL